MLSFLKKSLVLVMFCVMGVNLVAQEMAKPVAAPASATVVGVTSLATTPDTMTPSAITVEVDVILASEDNTVGQIEAAARKVNFLALNRGHLQVYETKRWFADGDGSFWVSVQADGRMSGSKWASDLKNGGIKVDYWTRKFLEQKYAFETAPEGYYAIKIMKGSSLFKGEATLKEIRLAGEKLGLYEAPSEIAFLLRKLLTSRDMRTMGGYTIVPVQVPTLVESVYGNITGLFVLSEKDEDTDYLSFWGHDGDEKWSEDHLFAFMTYAKGRPGPATCDLPIPVVHEESETLPVTTPVPNTSATGQTNKSAAASKPPSRVARWDNKPKR